jgi:hypothetical protein
VWPGAASSFDDEDSSEELGSFLFEDEVSSDLGPG